MCLFYRVVCVVPGAACLYFGFFFYITVFAHSVVFFLSVNNCDIGMCTGSVFLDDGERFDDKQA